MIHLIRYDALKVVLKTVLMIFHEIIKRYYNLLGVSFNYWWVGSKVAVYIKFKLYWPRPHCRISRSRTGQGFLIVHQSNVPRSLFTCELSREAPQLHSLDGTRLIPYCHAKGETNSQPESRGQTNLLLKETYDLLPNERVFFRWN